MKYLRSIYESIDYPSKSALSQHIKWEMINDAKDMALDFLDEGYTLLIEAIYSTVSLRTSKTNCHYVYRLIFNHKKDREYWTKQDWYVTKKISENNLNYRIRIVKLSSCSYTIDPVKTFKFLTRLRSAYPTIKKKMPSHDCDNFHILQPLK